jgi:hypothetical protein
MKCSAFARPFPSVPPTSQLCPKLPESAVTESLANVTYWKLTVLTARCKSTKGIQGNSLAGLLDPDQEESGSRFPKSLSVRTGTTKIHAIS